MKHTIPTLRKRVIYKRKLRAKTKKTCKHTIMVLAATTMIAAVAWVIFKAEVVEVDHHTLGYVEIALNGSVGLKIGLTWIYVIL